MDNQPTATLLKPVVMSPHRILLGSTVPPDPVRVLTNEVFPTAPLTFTATNSAVTKLPVVAIIAANDDMLFGQSRLELSELLEMLDIELQELDDESCTPWQKLRSM